MNVDRVRKDSGMGRSDRYTDWAELLRVLAHPVRLALLEELASGAKCVTDVSELLQRTQPNISQHLAVLRQAGIVGYSEDGKKRCYHVLYPDLVGKILNALGALSSGTMDVRGGFEGKKNRMPEHAVL